MNTLPECPKCSSVHTYSDRSMLVCPECSHEWSALETSAKDANLQPVYKDAHGNILKDGDTVVVIKDLKVKGSSLVVKGGTKVKNIRLTEGDHDIDCKIKGVGSMQLKTEFVKKANS